MRKLFWGTFILFFLFNGTAFADSISLVDSWANGEVDRYALEVNTAGNYDFDTWAYENLFDNHAIDPDNLPGTNKIDTILYLFASDGTLLAANNDDFGGGAADGSTSTRDAYIPSMYLDTGLYYTMVTGKMAPPSHIWSGTLLPSEPVPGGFYQITVNSNLSDFNFEAVPYSSAAPVPEPATIFLLGSGLAGFIGFKRKKA